MDAATLDVANGTAPAKVNRDVVELLAKALMEAKRGQWQGVALVLCPNDGNVAVACGGLDGHQFALNFGADLLKAQIGASVMRPRVSPILRADPAVLKQ